VLHRVKLGHSMLLTLRGVPTIYYGDEQGFVSDGKDQLAREDMFASQGRSL
jgi:glycosidase